jgi:hypothetical protein
MQSSPHNLEFFITAERNPELILTIILDLHHFLATTNMLSICVNVPIVDININGILRDWLFSLA